MYDDKLIQAIKVNDYMKYMMNMYNIYNNMSYLQQLTYMCSIDEENKVNNIKHIIENASSYGYKINNCTEYRELIICLENIKSTINNQVEKYINSKIKEKIIEQITRKVFNI